MSNLWKVGVDYFTGLRVRFKKTPSIEIPTLAVKKKKAATMAEQLLLALSNDPAPQLQTKDLAEIIDLFCTKKELALYIRSIDSAFLPRLIYEYQKLFLEDGLTEETLKHIVKSLLGLKVEKFILLLIIDAYQLSQVVAVSDGIEIRASRLVSDYVRHVQLVSLSIRQAFRDRYRHVQPSDFIARAFLRLEPLSITRVADYSTRLSNFVSLSVLRGGRHALKNYNFWDNVFSQLIGDDDYLSAFAVGSGLEQKVVEDIVGLYAKRREILNPTFGFREYRKVTSTKGGRYVPALVVIMAELEKMTQLKFFKDSLLEPKMIKYLKEFRAELRATQKFSHRFIPKPPVLLYDRINNIPSSSPTPSSTSLASPALSWRDAYNAILGK